MLYSGFAGDFGFVSESPQFKKGFKVLFGIFTLFLSLSVVSILPTPKKEEGFCGFFAEIRAGGIVFFPLSYF